MFSSQVANEAPAPAPDGYRLATDAAVFEGKASAALAGVAGARVLATGRYTTVQFTSAAQRQLSGGKLLPTFRDAAGRVVAATGGVVIRARTAGELSRARALGVKHNLAKPIRLKYGEALYYVEPGNDGWDAVRAVAELKAAGVEAELDMVRPRVLSHVPDDPRFAEQWHLRNPGDKESIAAVDGRVSEAWDITKGSPDVVIAINDDGVDVTHPDLAPNCLAPMNFPEDWEQQKSQMVGFASHGTSCAGVAAAVGDNGLGGSGVCPSCKILPRQLAEMVGGHFNLSDKDEADGFVAQVDAGAAVISNSWGPALGDARFEIPSFPGGPVSSVVAASLDYAETKGRDGKGTVVVFAAGNENTKITAESIYKTVVSVAAVDDQGLKSYYSCWGKQLSIAAPSSGGNRGINTTAVTPTGSEPKYTESFGGTSSACPFVAGVVGLMFSANPELTASEARSMLKASATKIDPVWGQWDANGFSQYYGAGLVNAYTAVKMAAGLCTAASECPAPSDVCVVNCEKTDCSPCRTGRDCAEGRVCQPLPALGRAVCVEKDTGAGCAAGYELVNGYCLPDRTTCDLCGSEEVCNGRDDDCNGTPDDGISCQGVQDCIQTGKECGQDEVCAATHCAVSCNTEEDCEEGATCAPVKDRYGISDPTVTGCASQGMGGCREGCQVLVSSLDDAKMKEFIECMEDGEVSCSGLMSCVSLLPISWGN
jgi:subtilisin family serine protease